MGNIITDERKRWYMGNIPYEVHPSVLVNTNLNDALNRAIQIVNYWSPSGAEFVRHSVVDTVTGIRRIEAIPTRNHIQINPRLFLHKYTNELDFLIFASEALITRIDGSTKPHSNSNGKKTGPQYIYLPANLTNEFAIIHEIFHAAGIAHEHQRNDRDNFIEINWDNVNDGRQYQIKIGYTPIGDYDFGSLMHYGERESSGGPIVITARVTIPAGVKMGQQSYISDGDLQSLRNLYPNGGFRRILGTINIVSNLAIEKNHDGRIEIFARSVDSKIHHIWQTEEGPWSEWSELGNGFLFYGNPAVARNQNGRLEVFCRRVDGVLMHIWQANPGGDWSGWSELFPIASDPGVEINSNGTLEVFAQGHLNNLGHAWQHSPGSGWHNWESFNIPMVGVPKVAKNLDGRLEIFFRQLNPRTMQCELKHIWNTSPSGSWNSTPHNLGGDWLHDPTIGINSDGRLEIFIIGKDNTLYHRWQVTAGGGWNSDWAKLGGDFKESVSSCQNSSGLIELFCLGRDNKVYHLYQTDTGWSEILTFCDTIHNIPSSVSGNRIIAFVVGKDNRLYERWQNAPGGNWEKE